MKPSNFFKLGAFVCVFMVAGLRADSIPVYTKMQEDLKELKADFNAASDKTRLLFILSPT